MQLTPWNWPLEGIFWSSFRGLGRYITDPLELHTSAAPSCRHLSTFGGPVLEHVGGFGGAPKTNGRGNQVYN